jgi:hypothetical protein
MLEPNGRQVLSIIGKLDTESPHKGILLPDAMPAAILALQAAIAEEDEQRKQRTLEALKLNLPAPTHEGISLRQRATPFIEMLRRCHRSDKEIVWGV